MKKGVSSKQKFAGERKESLRDYLKATGHHTQAYDIINKLKDLEQKIDASDVNRLRIALDGHFKFIGKYIPDVKSVEYTIGEHGEQSAEDHIQAIGEIISFPASRSKVATGGS